MSPRRFVLTPNRSFSRISTGILFDLLGLWLIAVGVFSFTHKTWPILGFAGLELVGLALAFTVHSYRSRVFEEVVLSRDTLTWTRHLPSGATQRWQAPLSWTQIATDAPDDTRSPLTFRYAGQTLVFGEFLSPEDRGSFAAEFRAAQQALQAQHV